MGGSLTWVAGAVAASGCSPIDRERSVALALSSGGGGGGGGGAVRLGERIRSRELESYSMKRVDLAGRQHARPDAYPLNGGPVRKAGYLRV